MSKAYEEARARFMTRRERARTEVLLASIDGLGFVGFADDSTDPSPEALFPHLHHRGLTPRSLIGLPRSDADTVEWLCRQLEEVGIGPDCLVTGPAKTAGVPWARVRPTRDGWIALLRSLQCHTLLVLGLEPTPRVLGVTCEEHSRRAFLLEPDADRAAWRIAPNAQEPCGRALLAAALTRFEATPDLGLLVVSLKDAAEYGVGRESGDWYVGVIRSKRALEDILALASDAGGSLTEEQRQSVLQEVVRLRALGPLGSHQP